MDQDAPDEKAHINADMTILDVVSRYRQTVIVFKRYDDRAGVCLCCQALFDPLKDAAKKYALNLEQFLADLELVARSGKSPIEALEEVF